MLNGTPPDTASIAAEQTRLSGLLAIAERQTYVAPARAIGLIVIICIGISFWPVDRLGVDLQLVVACILVGRVIASAIDNEVELDVSMYAMRKNLARWDDVPSEFYLEVFQWYAAFPECEAYRAASVAQERKLVTAEFEDMRMWVLARS